jgi:hypothetical protein
VDGKLDRELFTQAMQEAIFPDRVNDAAKFLKSLGEQKSFTLVEFKNDGSGQKVYRYRIAFSGQNVMLTGTLNDTGKISGLVLSPD